MIDKLAGLPTQIRQLEKRLKEMDASKVKPALVKEITDTIKNLKDMLKEKQDKKEQRKKSKEQTTQEVEAAPVAPAPAIGATAPNAVPATIPGQPEATPTTPDDQKISCPLCGGMTFNDQASYQQHMEFTHASDIMPTTPGQKLDKTVAAIETPAPTPEVASVPEDKGPQFKLDDVVMPNRGSESKGKVMRWDGKPNDLVYVMWESGPLKDRDTFGGYYPHDLQAVAQEPVEAVATPAEPVCQKCLDMQQKHGDLRGNYDALLKDLQEEREIHYTQGNNAWVARLDQKIDDLKKSIEEKFSQEKTSDFKSYHGECPVCKRDSDIQDLGNDTSKCSWCGTVTPNKTLRTPPGNPDMHFAAANSKCVTCGKEMTPEWKGNVTCSEKCQIALRNKELEKTSGAQNAEELTIMDHTPPRANSGPDAGGKDPADEFQDEWAMPLTSATKINIFKRELLATPANGGYDISTDGKKLFNIKGKEGKPMNKKQLEFCAQIEFTRGMKQAKLVEKIASLEVGSTVFVMAQDKTTKRVKFASLEHGFRGWAPVSKFSFLVKEGEMRKHQDHIDNTFGHNGKQMLCDCPNGSGNMVWVGINELLPINPPPATPESLNDLESAKKKKRKNYLYPAIFGLGCHNCGQSHNPGDACSGQDGSGAPASAPAAPAMGVAANLNFPLAYFTRPEAKERADQFGLIDVEDHDLTPAGLAAKKQEMIEGHDIEAAGKKPNIKNPISWNGANYFDVLVDMDGNVVSGYTYEQGEEAGWDLYFTPEEDIAWNDGELVLVYTDGKSPELAFQWGGAYSHQGFTGFPEDQQPAKEAELLPKIMSQIKVSMGKTAAKECPDCHGTFQGAEGEKCPTCGRFAVQKTALEKAFPQAILPQRDDVNTTIDPINGPSDADVQQKAYEMFKAHWDALSSEQMDQVYKALGVTSSLKIAEYKDKGVGEFECFECSKRFVSEGKLNDHKTTSKHKSPKKSSLDKSAGSDLDNDILENALELYLMEDETWDAATKEGADKFDSFWNAINNIGEEELAQKYPEIWMYYTEGLDYMNDPEGLTPDVDNRPSVIVNKLPVLDKGQKIDELLEQLSKESDPAKQQKIKQHIDRIKRASLVRQAFLNKVARVVHRDDGWHVLSEKGKNLGGPYKSKGEAVKRLRQVEYFKHHGAIRPFSRKVFADALTDHINDMKGRITEVQDRLQTVPAVKTGSSSQEVTQEQALPNHYIVQFVQIYDSYGPDAFCFLKATYDLAPQLEDNGFILDIDGPSVSGDQVANAENMDHGDVNEELAYRLEKKWPVFLAKMSKVPDPLTPEMREQLQGEIAVGHEEDLKQELAKAQQSVDQLRQQLGDLGVSAKLKALLKKKALKKTAARPDPDDSNNPDSPGYESEESDLMDNFVQLSNGSFALVQSHDEGGMIEVDILGKTPTGYKYVTDSPIPVPVSAVKRILEWDEIQALKIEHEPWPTETPVKEADQITDETIVTNDPNAIIDPTNPLSPAQAVVAPDVKNVQPTDDDNLEVPVTAPTSPPPPGQKWIFDTQFNKYVLMPDPALGKTI